MITLLQNKNNFYNYRKPITFKAYDCSAYASNSLDMAGRKLINGVSDVFEKSDTKVRRQELLDDNLSMNERYIKAGRLYGSDMDIEINTENGILDKLTDDNSAKIFIMNHDNQSSDPKLFLIFNTLLMEMYKSKGKENDCPSAKIILNENILKSLSPDKKALLEKLGAVGVDISGTTSNPLKNAKKLLPVMKDFADDKVNIFIFPEGKMSVFKSKPIEEKFQNGIANVILKELKMKDSVQVVPLGFSYPKKQNLAGIYVGEPITLKSDENGIYTTKGNILTSEYSNPDYKNYYKNFEDKEFSPILEHGKKVLPKDSVPYIAGLLCENLKICKAESYNMLEKNKEDKTVTLV